MAPSHNHVDHGFYMFSPTLFHDFYDGERLALDAEYCFEFTRSGSAPASDSPPWRIRRYTPGCLDASPTAASARRQVALFVVATRSGGATADRIPQQSYYRRFWSEEAQNRTGVELQTQRVRRSLLVEQLEARLDGRPLLSRLWFLWKQLRSAVAHRLPRRLPPPDLRY